MLLLIIFLLLFASVTMAIPTDGTDETYQNMNLLDDLSDIVFDAWVYVNSMSQPGAADQVVYADNMDGAVASPPTAQGLFQYPSPDPSNIQPYVYPQVATEASMFQQGNHIQTSPPIQETHLPTEATSDLTASNVMQFDENQPQMDVAVQGWVDEAYATGYRFQSPNYPQGPVHMQTIQQDPNNVATLPQPPHSERTQSLQPLRTPGQPSTPSASLGNLRCDHPGCRYRCWRQCDLQHHLRYHIPMRRRPYECPLCHHRFLYPREVRRHMSTHGLGDRHHCPNNRCRFATRGFGRPDHLLRHLRRCH